MKKWHTVFIGIILFTSLSHQLSAQTIELNFNITDAELINTKLSGFNTGPTFNDIFEASNSPVSIVDACAIFPPPFNTFNDFKIISFTPQPDLVEKTAELKPATMRFPGGTISNFYHLYEYEDGSYDPDSPTFAAGCGTQDEETSIISGIIRDQYCKKDPRVILDDPSENPNYIQGFINYVHAVEAEVHASGDPDYRMDVIYVPNVFAHFENKFLGTVVKEAHLEPSDLTDDLNIADPTQIFELYYKEVIDAINYLYDHDINLVGIEFGNELFFPFYQTANSNVTPEAYMALCNIYSKRITEEHPELKFSVLSEPSNVAWNNAIKAYTPVFYDAVSLHDYYTNNACITEGSACADGCLDDYVTDRTCRFDCGKCALGDYTRHELSEDFSDALDGFPENTKLWLTEWGIISPGTYTGSNLDYMNTFLYACFTQDHLMAQLLYNATNSNAIEFSTHHRIGYKNRWSVIQTRLGPDTSLIQSNFYTYKYFEKLAQSTTAYAYDGISIPGLTDSNDVNMTSFFVQPNSSDQRQILLYYSNKTSENIPLHFSEYSTTLFEGKTYDILDLAHTSYLQAADSTGLYSSFGFTKFNATSYDNTDYHSLITKDNLEIDLSTYEIPALTSGVIEIDLDEVAQIDKEPNNFEMQLYPNPANDKIQLIVNNSVQPKSIQINSISGELIIEYQDLQQDDYQFDISSLDAGVYLVKVIFADGESVLKFVKQSHIK